MTFRNFGHESERKIREKCTPESPKDWKRKETDGGLVQHFMNNDRKKR